MRWSIRFLGIISITVLARLLSKEDFGLVAIASAIIALPAALIDFGVEGALLRDNKATPATYNTAWTIRALQMSIVGVLLFLSAPYVAALYGDTRLVLVVQVLAVMVFLQGIENIWVVSFRKQLQFSRDFTYNALSRLVATFCTIGLAFWLRSYWALVLGQLIHSGVRIVVGTAMAKALPKPTLSEWHRIWDYSKWSLFSGFAFYLSEQSDRLILGRATDLSGVGTYSIGKEVALFPIAELSMPANRALTPGLAQLQDEPKRFSAALAKAIGAVSTLALPMGIGLALTAKDAIPLLLGSGWAGAIPVVELLGLGSAFAAGRRVLGNGFRVNGQIKQVAYLSWLNAAGLIGFGILCTSQMGIVGMAVAVLLTELVSTCACAYYSQRFLQGFTLRLVLHHVSRAVFATVAMIIAVKAVDPLLQPGVYRLFGDAIVGAITYSVALLASWYVAKMPDGIEQQVLTFVKQRLGKAG